MVDFLFDDTMSLLKLLGYHKRYVSSSISPTSLKMTIRKCGVTVGQKKKKGTPLLIPMQIIVEKCVPINMDYFLLQFDAIKFFLEVRLHGRSLPNFILFNVTPKILTMES